MPSPEPSADTSIRTEQVVVDLGGRRILSEVCVDVSARRIAVIGANGSGKSTFARLLNGLVSPTSGTVRVHGLEVSAHTAQVRRRVGFVFSSPDAQILMPTVSEDVALSLRGSGLDRDTIAERVTGMLRDYGLADHADAPAYSLSGGQKQMLALASVLVREPDLVVADEPTTLLDRANARRVGDLLLDELPMQILVVTHDLDLAARCDVAILFADGRVHAVGEGPEVVDTYLRMEP